MTTLRELMDAARKVKEVQIHAESTQVENGRIENIDLESKVSEVSDIVLIEEIPEEDFELSEADETDEESSSSLTEFNHPLMSSLSPELVDAFRENLEFLYASLDEPELVASATVNTLLMLKENPQLCEILAPETAGHMVAALRASHGAVLELKTSNRTKRKEKANIFEDLSFSDEDLGVE